MANISEKVPTLDVADELPTGTQLMSGQYEITGYLNHGGFGITYLANDSLNRQVVVKECFPGSLCRRSRLAVQARSRAHVKDLEGVVRLFMKEAQALSKLAHPNIVGVHQVFEDHGTAYMVLDYVDGADLLTYIENAGKQLTPAQIRTILMKVLDAIAFVHDAGVLHRDISPDNIILTKSLEPILIDFGAARQKATKTTQALSALRVVKDGYSPQEFYLAGSTQAPASDLYSLAASFYHLISGEIPPDSQLRLTAHVSEQGDPYVPLGQKTDAYDAEFCAAIDKALAILPRDRIQNAAEWKDMLEAKPAPKSKKVLSKVPSRRLSRQTRQIAAPAKVKAAKTKRKASLPALAIGLVAGGVLVAGTVLAPSVSDDQTSVTAPPAVLETAADMTQDIAPAVSEPVETTQAAATIPTVTAASTTTLRAQPANLQTDWADGQITLGWRADLPFVFDSVGSVRSVDEGVTSVPVGSRLMSVNGQAVDDVNMVMAAIENAAAVSDGQSAQFSFVWASPDGADVFTSELRADVLYQTTFESGVVFETRYVAGNWVTQVTETPQVPNFALHVGDEIVALVPENERIDGVSSLAEVTAQAWSQDRTDLQFAVRRNNTLWIADVSLAGETG
ncbi:serine/threonine protein kinase [Yoonia maricola]|uniref:non-specific serine/threonine protein kinase n=1 Tax=Yoonia maricola TaxID=420999 RepID=A0A2M8WKR9_9RHOB|nr:serine/threonine-protein kinase [Yoonia maricola]PJI91529.1 serine/threonine protein kinase [Yoonia maricola]